MTKKPVDENTEKRKRDSPGLAGNRAKEPHIDVNVINTIDEEDEDKMSDSESNMSNMKDVNNMTEA